MLISQERRAQFLGQMAVFQGLEGAELLRLAENLAEYPVRNGDLLYRVGDRADNFYLLYSGELSPSNLPNSSAPPAALEAGDHFGAPALLNGSSRTQTIYATRDSILLYLPKRPFFDLISRHPSVAEGLNARAAAREIETEIDFEWLQDGEKVHHLMRKHSAYLWQRFARPILLLIGALLALNTSLTSPSPFQWLLGAGAGAFLAVVWALWEYFDWRNDYYVITNQRVVWLEHMLLRSSSRKEAPLSAIQQVNVYTSQLARLLGYGDLIVRTYTGTVPMPAVPTPHHAKEMIEEYVERSRTESREERHEHIRQAVRQSLGKEEAAEAEEWPEEAPPETHMVDPGERFQLFKTRHVDGDTVTYHRHWFVLFSRLIFPALFFVGIIYGARVFFAGWPPDTQNWLLTIAFAVLPLLVMLYRILDWQNDIYQVTAENLIDTDKKPLGSEVTKSAPLANILSLENHRVGLLGLLLNFGEVRINVGDSSLDFTDVHNPPLVQQDIYVRMQALQNRQGHARDKEDRERIAEWLKVYEEERQAEGERDEQIE